MAVSVRKSWLGALLRASRGPLAAAALGALACGPPKIPLEFTEQTFEETEYRISPSDLLVVRVWRNPELSVEAPVLPDGTITVPLAGTLHARGLTSDELEDVIGEKLQEYVTAPEVAVVVRQVNGKRVTVMGEVLRPGSFSLGSNVRLLEAISSAGGFTPFADTNDIKVIRHTEHGDIEFEFDYGDFVDGDAPDTNVLLMPDDLVVVPD